MRKILAIAAITYKETLRNKFLNVLLLFAVISIAATRFFTIFAPSEESKIIQDTSLGIIRFIGVLIAVFTAAGLLPREMERHTVTTVISKPVSRLQFLFGKFFGGLYVIAVSMFIMSVMLAATLLAKDGAISSGICKALALITTELVVLASITLCVSTIASEIFNIIFGVLIFIIGHLTNYLQYLADKFDSLGMKTLLLTLYTILPNFENFNIQNAIVLGTEVSAQYVVKAISYGFIYAAMVLILGYLFFAEREV